MSPKGYLSDSISEDELLSMRLPELQQVIDFLLANLPEDHVLPLQQLKRVRSELQDVVRAAVTTAIGELEPVIQLSLVARADALPLAVIDRALAERSVVQQLPTALREELQTRARASSMKWWRRHARG